MEFLVRVEGRKQIIARASCYHGAWRAAKKRMRVDRRQRQRNMTIRRVGENANVYYADTVHIPAFASGCWACTRDVYRDHLPAAIDAAIAEMGKIEQDTFVYAACCRTARAAKRKSATCKALKLRGKIFDALVGWFGGPRCPQITFAKHGGWTPPQQFYEEAAHTVEQFVELTGG